MARTYRWAVFCRNLCWSNEGYLRCGLRAALGFDVGTGFMFPAVVGFMIGGLSGVTVASMKRYGSATTHHPYLLSALLGLFSLHPAYLQQSSGFLCGFLQCIGEHLAPNDLSHVRS